MSDDFSLLTEQRYDRKGFLTAAAIGTVLLAGGGRVGRALGATDAQQFYYYNHSTFAAAGDSGISDFFTRRARIEVDYPDGTVQEGEVALVWPEQIEDWLAAAGLELVRMFGHPDAELEESPAFYVVAVKPLEPGSGFGVPRSR